MITPGLASLTSSLASSLIGARGPVVAASGAAGAARGVGALMVLFTGVGAWWDRARQRRMAARSAPPPRERAGASLARSRPSQWELDDADLHDADLRRARLAGRDLTDRDLSDADLTGLSAPGLRAEGACFDRADLSWSKLRGSDLRRATFVATNLVEADLGDCTLHGADLRGALGMGSALWRGSRCDRYTRWPAGFSPRDAGVTVERADPPGPVIGDADR